MNVMQRIVYDSSLNNQTFTYQIARLGGPAHG